VLVDADGGIGPSTLHHLRRVLRLRPGDPLTLTDGRGRHSPGVLTTDGVVTEKWSSAVERPQVTLYVAVSKGSKVDFVVEKATEIGVAAIVPVMCERSERRPDKARSEARVQRWRTIAVSALEQSRGVWLPEIAGPEAFDDAVGEVCGRSAVLLHPGAGGGAAGILGAAPASVAVGPEGGFTDGEVATARSRGWRVCGLGDRVLRTETAAIVAAALAAAASGDLG